jgi:hypothetical protein
MRILFFSPNVAIIPHFSAELRLARLLTSNKTYEVEFLTCGSFFAKDCTISRYLGLSTQNSTEVNKNACSECRKVSKVADLKRNFQHRELKEFTTSLDESIFMNCREAISRDPINFSYNGINFGRIAAYELILEFKKNTLAFKDEQLETLINYVENSLRTYLAGLNYLSLFKPDRVIIFNAQYGVSASFAYAAAEKGIRVDVLSFSNVLTEMYQYIRLWDWGGFKNKNPGLETWQCQRLISSHYEKFRIARNFRLIKTASSPWTYSAPTSGINIRKFYKISQDKKIILAVMNSLDEYFAAMVSEILPKSFASTRVFDNQEDWIQGLADYLSKHDEVVLIVRPHPREFPNKREKVLAEITKSRDEFLAKLPLNVIVDYPELRVPIEDYFSEVIAITTGWSSVGLEWQMRGKLCVSYDSSLPMYPPETHLTGSTRKQYFNNIEKVIMGHVENPDNFTQNATSWYVFSNFKGAARLGSSILNEVYLGGLLKETRLLGVLNRYFPKLKIWLDLKSIGLFPNKKKILKYFSSDSKSFLSNL